MKSYADLIDQTFYFPTPEFRVEKNQLFFHDVDLMQIIEEYGTPLKISYLPKISENIHRAREIFETAMEKCEYDGKYIYCYCTKSSHFQFVLEETCKNGAHIETSSAFDIPIIQNLYNKGSIDKQIYIICNGFKRPLYLERVTQLLNDGFTNCIPVLDNLNELAYYERNVNSSFQLGIRVAADEEPNFNFYTSRLGIRYNDIIPHYQEKIKALLPKCEIVFKRINLEFFSMVYANRREYSEAYDVQKEAIEEDDQSYRSWYSLSYYAILTQRPVEAILAAKKTLELNPNAKSVETNLALGYLLNGQWKEAESIYKEWKGKNFPDDDKACNDLFLKDINDLEDVYITHPDFEKVRQLFKN